ncbi:MAG: hypothetical protein QXP44_06870, partial [Candidatus Bathyarchaeia archaeon]
LRVLPPIAYILPFTAAAPRLNRATCMGARVTHEPGESVAEAADAALPAHRAEAKTSASAIALSLKVTPNSILS